METIQGKVIMNLRRLLPSDKGSSILVALSGGKDSVTLLNILIGLKSDFKLQIYAAYVNHNLRGSESTLEEKFVTDYTAGLGIQLYKYAVNPSYWENTGRESIEMAARKIRYDFFNRIVFEKSLDFIATAHNLNDRIETFFIQVLRSGGIETLSSIPIKNKNIIRPY
jgi:tRNA(Ile)-lysidine synthase